MDQGHPRDQPVDVWTRRSRSMVTSMYPRSAVEHYPPQRHVNMRNEYV